MAAAGGGHGVAGGAAGGAGRVGGADRGLVPRPGAGGLHQQLPPLSVAVPADAAHGPAPGFSSKCSDSFCVLQLGDSVLHGNKGDQLPFAPYV